MRKDSAEHAELDQAALLLEYRWVVFQPAMDYSTGILEGLALLSRTSIVETNALALSLHSRFRRHKSARMLHAQLDLPPRGKPLHLFNAHFSWVYEQAQDNIAESLPHLNSFRGHGLLVSDLNVPPESPLFDPPREMGWSDV